MVWTKITQQQYRRDDLRYASDVRDSEWCLLAPLMPPPCRVGRPRKVDLREVVNAILYIAAAGIQWRALPKNFPPYTTVQYYFYGWRNGRIWQRINSVRQTRAPGGRTPSHTICRCDRQSECQDHGKWRSMRV